MRNPFVELPLKLTVMMLIAALLLGGVNMLTQGPILAQAVAKAEAFRKELLPAATDFEPLDVPDAPATLKAAYRAPSHGYIFEMETSGFGGALPVTVGFDEMGTITGIRLGSLSETPGLGAKAADEAFYGQFAGQAAQPLKVVKLPPNQGEIQAITAATITTDAVTLAVNDAIACYSAIAQP